MKWPELLKIAKDQPVIETNMLVNNPVDLPKLRVQLSRWVKSGQLIRIKNGVYILSDNYRPKPVQYEYISTLIYRPAYISFEYALADYGLIPEGVPTITLVTANRPHKIQIRKKLLIYQHIKNSLFWGYETRGTTSEPVYFAYAEKALLDYFYFRSEKICQRYLDEMRLQNTENLDLEKLKKFAEQFKSPKMIRVANELTKYAFREREEYKEL